MWTLGVKEARNNFIDIINSYRADEYIVLFIVSSPGPWVMCKLRKYIDNIDDKH